MDAGVKAKPGTEGAGAGMGWYGVAALAALGLDLATKAWADALLGPLAGSDGSPPRWWLVPGWIRLGDYRNTGGAFSLFSGKVFVFVAAPLILVPALALFARNYRRWRTPLWTLGLASGGALGNLYDRLGYGYVRDFIDVMNPFDPEKTIWPAFNIADIAIVVGLAAFVPWSWRSSAGARNTAKPEAGPGEGGET
jgi:signal peptidase II